MMEGLACHPAVPTFFQPLVVTYQSHDVHTRGRPACGHARCPTDSAALQSPPRSRPVPAVRAGCYARELSPSLFMMLRTWVATVASEMNSALQSACCSSLRQLTGRPPPPASRVVREQGLLRPRVRPDGIRRGQGARPSRLMLLPAGAISELASPASGGYPWVRHEGAASYRPSSACVARLRTRQQRQCCGPDSNACKPSHPGPFRVDHVSSGSNTAPGSAGGKQLANRRLCQQRGRQECCGVSRVDGGDHALDSSSQHR